VSGTSAQFWPFFVFVVGVCIGSFLMVCIFRLPRGNSLVRPGSSCPGCGHALAWWENIPILSFLLLRGRCSSCNSRISLRYPAVEVLSGLLALALWHRFGLSPELFVYAYFSATLLVVAFIDFEHQIIPDTLSLPGIVLGFAASFILPETAWYESLLGILVGGGALYLVALAYYLLAGREGMGGGDVKLLAMIGAFLGWRAVPLVIFLSAAAGSVAGVAMVLAQRKGIRHTPVPYGPFLSGAALLVLFYGNSLISWYVAMLQGD